MAEQKHLYLVDGSGYIFRAYHRLPPLTNKRGEPVGAVYGYTTMLWKLADALHKADGPTHLAVILDASPSSFRNELYDQYKAHRPPPPEDLVPQFPMIRDATCAFSLPCIEEEGLEADDLIACYTHAATALGWKVTIVSSDKDLMQLIVEGKVDMLDTMKNERLGPHAVIEKFGVGPDKLGEVLALMGDSVDNVPGVPGIGPKTAAKLIQEHGDVEAVLAAALDMKPSKIRDNLIEHAANARMSRQLVELKCDAPLPRPLEELELTGIPEDPLRAFLENHGFLSLLKRLGGPMPVDRASANLIAQKARTANDSAEPWKLGEQSFDLSKYECVQTVEALQTWIAASYEAGSIAIDTETDGVDSMGAGLVGVSIATGCNRACYIPLRHGGDDLLSETPEQVPFETALGMLKPLFEDSGVLKIGHNLKYDLNVLARHDIHVAPIDDTLVMSFDLDAGRHGHGMDELALIHFGHKCISFKELCGTGKKQCTFDKIALPDATRYAAEDADVTYRLWCALKPRLPREAATRVYHRVDRPLIPALAAMEREGIKVDRDVLAAMSKEFGEGCLALESEVHGLAGQSFTLGSPKQLGDILFGKMGLQGGKKGKSGEYSTDVNVLEKLAGEGAEIARKVLDWRQLSKLRSTYTDALQQQINPQTGRVHTCYSLSGAQTGRLSSTDPNLQNIPIRTEVGRRIREAFVAEPGNVLLSADYSQIELRLAAHMADVPALKEAFANGDDIHSLTAQQVFGEVNRDTRGRAKTINFSILYGISRWGLAQRMGIKPDEAQDMIDRYFARFPGINHYISSTLQAARENGFTETLFGRKTHFTRIKSPNPTERAGSERAAINAPIQGTSADIIKRAMVRMGPALADAGLAQVKMLLQVHDELVFELPEGDVAASKPVIARVMAEAAEPLVKLDVPLGVEIGTGHSWGSAH